MSERDNDAFTLRVNERDRLNAADRAVAEGAADAGR